MYYNNVNVSTNWCKYISVSNFNGNGTVTVSVRIANANLGASESVTKRDNVVP